MEVQAQAARRAVPTLVLAAVFVAALAAWERHAGARESVLGPRWSSDSPETRAEKQSLALEAVGRILQHHKPSAASAPKHPDYWPGVSFFAKRREQAWRARKEAESHSAMQQLREQPPRGPSGQKLSPAQAAIAAKFNALSGASSTAYSKFETEYEHETGHRPGHAAEEPRPKRAGHARDRATWGSTWKVDSKWGDGAHSPRRAREKGFSQSLQGEGESEEPEGEAHGGEDADEPLGEDEEERVPEGGEHEAALEAEVRELKKELGHVESQVQEEVRHGYNSGMHVEGGSTRSGAVWDGSDRRLVTPSSALEGDGEPMAEGGGVATGAEGEKDYDKYGVELDKWRDPTPLHYRDDIAGGVEAHTREDEIRKIREYQAKIAAEQGKMRDDWKKLMTSPPEVTDATRPDIMDPDSFPTEGEAFHKKYQEMKDFKAAVEAFNHDPEFNPMIVLKAHHLVKYGIPAPESDNIYVWRQWYREALDKYRVVRHQVTDMAAGNWHDYDTDWDIHSLHRPGAYKKVWRSRDSWGPGKPHTAIVTSPNANFTYSEGGGVVEEADGGHIRNETAAEFREAESEAAGGAGENAVAAEDSSSETAEAVRGEGVAGEAAAAGEGEEAGGGESVQESAPVAALASKVDHLEKKLDTVVNLLEASHGAAPAASTLRATTKQHLAQQRRRGQQPLRKAYLPSAAERDRIARGEQPQGSGGDAAVASMKGAVSSLAAAKDTGAAPQQLRAAATAAAVAALGSKAKGGSAAEKEILSHPPKSVLNWLASALQAADKKGDDSGSAQALQTLASGRAPAKATAPAAASAAVRAVPSAVQKMIERGSWADGAQTPSAPAKAANKMPPLYTATDAQKDAAARAAAKAAISAAESVNAPDSVVRAKSSSKSVMQTGPDPTRKAKVNSDPLQRVAKAILVEDGSTKAKEAEGEIAKGDVDPEGKQYSAPVPKTLTKKFVAGRTMYVPKYDHKRAGGDGWGWLW